MARAQLLALIRDAGHAVGESDADLLGRFVSGRESAAFAELVRRYSRLVWGQCRNLLANDSDADDAFQATFFALAKSAPSVRDSDRLGPWLHAVAHRVCLNARRAAARRTKRERGSAVSEGARPVADSAWDTAAAAVHEEVNLLPESLRVAFVLCCLEGKAPTDAAAQLGLKWGTFSSRLSRAKQRLLDRLTARGIGSEVAVGTVGGANASAAAVARVAALGSNTASVSASVLALTSGVVTMSISRGKLLAMLAAVVVVAVGVPGLFAPGDAAPGAVAHAAPIPKPAPEVKGKKLEELWGMLLAQNEAVASRALLEMSARPKADVVAFVAGQLKPLKLTEERAAKLVADLGGEKDEVAKAAFEEMQYFDPRLVLDVGAMLKPLLDGVHRQRIAGLLTGREFDSFAECKIEYSSAATMRARMGIVDAAEDVAATLSIDDSKKVRAGRYGVFLYETVAQMSKRQSPVGWVRATRAVMLLEHLGTPAAIKALEAMATGHEDASPTVAAKEALARLEKK